jgi:DNA polymerase V
MARLNIHDYLVKNDQYTFMVRVVGESMRDAGLLPGDIAVVDRSRAAAIGNIVLAVIEGEFTIKQLSRADNGNVLLCPANAAYKAIEITEAANFEIWGVVTGTLRKYL